MCHQIKKEKFKSVNLKERNHLDKANCKKIMQIVQTVIKFRVTSKGKNS